MIIVQMILNTGDMSPMKFLIKIMKSYTDIEQSKKLAEILPIESADMCFNDNEPCWSLATLLEFLPEFKIEKTKAEDGYEGYYYFVSYKDLIAVPYNKELIDGFVEMIVRLKNEDLL